MLSGFACSRRWLRPSREGSTGASTLSARTPCGPGKFLSGNGVTLSPEKSLAYLPRTFNLWVQRHDEQTAILRLEVKTSPRFPRVVSLPADGRAPRRIFRRRSVPNALCFSITRDGERSFETTVDSVEIIAVGDATAVEKRFPLHSRGALWGHPGRPRRRSAGGSLTRPVRMCCLFRAAPRKAVYLLSLRCPGPQTGRDTSVENVPEQRP